MSKKLRMTEGERNQDQVNVIKKVLDKMKKSIKNVPKNKTFKIEDNKKKILLNVFFTLINQNKKEGGLKILTPNQMLSRLPITLAQLKARNNSEKN